MVGAKYLCRLVPLEDQLQPLAFGYEREARKGALWVRGDSLEQSLQVAEHPQKRIPLEQSAFGENLEGHLRSGKGEEGQRVARGASERAHVEHLERANLRQRAGITADI